MYAYNPLPTHHVNRNNCTLALRRSAPDNVCGDLHAVEFQHVEVGYLDFNAGKTSKSSISIIVEAPSEYDANTSPSLPKTSSDADLASVSPATPSRVASRNGDDCICLTYIGDRGACPVHGDGPK